MNILVHTQKRANDAKTATRSTRFIVTLLQRVR